MAWDGRCGEASWDDGGQAAPRTAPEEVGGLGSELTHAVSRRRINHARRGRHVLAR
jgi:hypothetical protein